MRSIQCQRKLPSNRKERFDSFKVHTPIMPARVERLGKPESHKHVLKKQSIYICSHLVCHLDWQPCSNLISSPSCQCGYTWFNNIHESVMSIVNSTCILSSDVVVSINCILLRDFFDLNIVFVLVFRDPKGQKEIRY